MGGAATIATSTHAGHDDGSGGPGPRSYSTGADARYCELPPPTAAVASPTLPTAAGPNARPFVPLVPLVPDVLLPPGTEPDVVFPGVVVSVPPGVGPICGVVSSGSGGLTAPSPGEPWKRGLEQLAAVSCTGAVLSMRPIEFDISCDRFGGRGE